MPPTMTQADRIARLRAFEFRRTLSPLLYLRYLLPWMRLRYRERVLATYVVGALWLLLGWFYASQLHAEGVRWAAVPWTHLALPWLLWGLAALIPLGAALICGWAWPEGTSATRMPRAVRPTLDLLPLTARQVCWAKIQGRGSAFGLALAVGFVLVVLTRALMVATGAVITPPPLLDWALTASALGFYLLFVLSGTFRLLARRVRPETATEALTIALLVDGGICAVLFLLLNQAEPGPWDVIRLGGLAAVLVTIESAAGLLWKPRARRAGTAAAPASAPSAPDRSRLAECFGLWMQSWHVVALYGLGGAKSQQRWRAKLAELAIGSACLVLLTALVLQLVLFVSDARPVLLHGGTFADALRVQTPEDYVIVLGLSLLLNAALIPVLGINAWPELPLSASRARPATASLVGTRLGEPRHLGYLLPMDAGRLWRIRFASLCKAFLVLGLTGIATCLLAWLVARAICGPRLALEPVRLVVLAAGVAPGLGLFAWQSLGRPIRRLFPFWGCLAAPMLGAAISVGAVLGLIVTVPLSEVGYPVEARQVALMAIAALSLPMPLMLLLSWWWSDLRSWSVDPSGRPSRAAMHRAVRAVLVALPMSISAAGLATAAIIVGFMAKTG